MNIESDSGFWTGDLDCIVAASSDDNVGIEEAAGDTGEDFAPVTVAWIPAMMSRSAGWTR